MNFDQKYFKIIFSIFYNDFKKVLAIFRLHCVLAFNFSEFLFNLDLNLFKCFQQFSNLKFIFILFASLV